MRVLLALLLVVGMGGCGGDSLLPDGSTGTPSSKSLQSTVESGSADTKDPQEESSSWPLGETITNSIGMKLQLIPVGSFRTTEPQGSVDNPTVRVRITMPFHLGVTEVTQGQYERVTDTNPSRYKGAVNPVEGVSWEDAVMFCRKLSALPAEKAAGHQYDLPTEIEWEYACRAGSTTSFSFGDEKSGLSGYGWFSKNSGSTTHAVGRKKPNAWGLYDMHGNVLEWCQDRHYRRHDSSLTEPRGEAPLQVNRAVRGGSWDSTAWICRSAQVAISSSKNRNSRLGFRVLRRSVK